MNKVSSFLKTPLEKIPLNTKQAYTMATFPNGCELFFPVDSRDDVIIEEAKEEMQRYLDKNFQVPDQLA